MVQSFATNLFEMTNDAEQDMGNIENALYSVRSSFSGPFAPSAEQGQLWYDTTRSLLRHRGATSNWRGVIAGSEDFKIWVYANAVEEGFTEDEALGDCVLGLKGGAQAYNVTGGDGNPKGVWAISDINAHSNHVHTIPHMHSLLGEVVAADKTISGATRIVYDEWRDYFTEDGGYAIAGGYDVSMLDGPNTQGSSAANTGNETSPLTHSTGGNWRPQAAVGIMIFPKVI